MVGPTAPAGIILEDGPNCGYIFAPNHKVTASIAFQCDRSATGAGHVSADTTSFMKIPTSTGFSFGSSSAAQVFDPGLFCNLNLTWRTSAVCGLPERSAETGSSWGGPVLIVMLCGAAIYFGGATFYFSKSPGAKASFWENMPHREFWLDVPGLLRDGVNFVSSGGQSQTHFTQFATESTPAIRDKPTRKGKKQKATESTGYGATKGDEFVE